MKPEKITILLPMIGSQKIGIRAGWVLATCPMKWRHDGDSHAFAVSFDPKKKSWCKCLSCGYSGDLTDVLLDIRFGLRKFPEFAVRFNLAMASPMVATEFEDMELIAADIPDFETPVVKHEQLFPELWLASFKSIHQFPEAVGYCVGRGIESTTLKALDVRYDPSQKRVCFPFRNPKGELMGVQGRSLEKDSALRYYQYGYHGHRNMHIWMGEDTLNLDQPVVLCEGPFDYAAIWQVYENVACSFTSGLSKAKVKRIGDADEIITFYDHGKGGDAARGSIRRFLPGYPIQDIIPTEDEDDAGAMSPEQICEYLSGCGIQ